MKIKSLIPMLLALSALFTSVATPASAATSPPLFDVDLDQLRFVVYRVYLPEAGFENVKLPTLTVVENGNERTLDNCPWIDSGDTPNFSKVQDLFDSQTTPDLSRMLEAAAGAAGVADAVPIQPFPLCSWWFTLDPSTVNIAYPDTSAAYWITPFFDDGNTEIRIDGEYGNQRYMSLTTYKNLHFFDYTPPSGETLSSTITDYQIEPNIPGSSPYQSETGSPQAPYTVTIKSKPQSHDVNVLPASPNESAHPANSERDTTFPIPCNVGEDFMCGTPGLLAAPPEEFQEGFFGNPANTYIATAVDLNPRRPTVQLDSRVLVIRGKLPETTPGSTSQVWPNPDLDLRYFSLCTGPYVRPYPTTTGPNACVADKDLVLTDRDGKPSKDGRWYTIVISTERDKPNNITGDPEVDGVNWLKGARLTRTILLLRNMLPNPEFAEAANNVPTTGSFRDAMDTMGDYYPTITVQCTTEAYEKYGWGTCVAPVVGGTNPFDPDIDPPGLPKG